MVFSLTLEYLSAGVYNVVVRTETSTATERVTVISNSHRNLEKGLLDYREGFFMR